MSGHDEQQVEASPTTWEWFKGKFGQGATIVQQQAVGMVKWSLSGLGITLSDEASARLLGHALKLGQTALCPIPSDELILDLEIAGLDRAFGGYAVKLGGVKLVGAEAWLYNFVNWQGPCLQAASLSIGSVSIECEGLKLTGSISLTAVKIGSSGGNVLAVIGEACALAFGTVAAAYLIGVSGMVIKVTELALIAARVKQSFMDRALGELKNGASTEAGTIVADFTVVTTDNQSSGQITGKNIKLDSNLQKGEMSGQGSLTVDLAGTVKTVIDAVALVATVAAAGKLDLDREALTVASLTIDFSASGLYAGEPVRLDALVTADNLSFASTTDRGALLDCILKSCAATVNELLPKLDPKKPDEAEAQLPPTLTQRLTETLARDLSARFKAKIGSLSVQVRGALYGEQNVEGSLAFTGGEFVGSSRGGAVKLRKPKGNLAIDLSGEGGAAIDGLTIGAVVTAKAGLSLDLQMLAVASLTGTVTLTGSYGGVPLKGAGSLAITNLSLAGTAGRNSLLDCVVSACAEAAGEALDGMKTVPPQQVPQQLPPTLSERIRAKLKDRLTTTLTAKFDSLAVDITALRYGEYGISGKLGGEDVTLGVGIKPDEAVDISFEGEVNIEQAVLSWGDSQLMDIHEISIELDENGTGTLSGGIVLHGDAVGEYANSKVVKWLLKNRDGCTFTAPITAYLLQLGGIAVALPNHRLLSFGVDKLVLDKIRVTNKGPKVKKFGKKRQDIEPTLKGITGDVVGGTLGQLPPQEGTDRILIAKQELEKGSQGAINLRAWMQNVLQSQLNTLLG